MAAKHVRATCSALVALLALAWACSSSSTNDTVPNAGGSAAHGGSVSDVAADPSSGGTSGGSGGSGGASTGGVSSGGSAGSTPDASELDVGQDSSLPCDPGFWTVPDPPLSAFFRMRYKSTQGYTCIELVVHCPNAGAGFVAEPQLYPAACPGEFCWGEEVTSCGTGVATASFTHTAVVNGSCPGGAGELVASCAFYVQ